MVPADYSQDDRVVMTLDAGGTSFRFSAMRAGKPITNTITLPAHGDNLELSLAGIIEGFSRVKAGCPSSPVAISFAFPGPADYPRGIIGDLGNLPAFRGGVALGPMLENKFDVPVLINNDGDLFTYGEAIGGFLPYVNNLLEKVGSPKRYRNLLGITVGTGLGGGIVHDGKLFVGDNSIGGEVWLMRNKLHPQMNAEQSASLRAVRRIFAAESGIPHDTAPDPKGIFEIGLGSAPGNQKAAKESFRQMGEVLGDVIGQALTLVDGLAVIGGGISGSWPLFLPALMEELNGTYSDFAGKSFRRLASTAFNLEETFQRENFLRVESREIAVPGSSLRVKYQSSSCVGVGISRLGTSEAIALGAYALALKKLDELDL